MTGLVPVIHAAPLRNGAISGAAPLLRRSSARRGVDARDEREHDGSAFRPLAALVSVDRFLARLAPWAKTRQGAFRACSTSFRRFA
jgi:hypothetical protein